MMPLSNFSVSDSVGEITADSILIVSVEIPSYPVLFLFWQFRYYAHNILCSYLMEMKSRYWSINKILSVNNLIIIIFYLL